METAKVFIRSGSQAVQLPETICFEGDEVFIKRMGHAVVLLPFHEPYQTLFDSLNMFSDDFMESREQQYSCKALED